MDQNIMKLLKDDKDDTMHSGADMEAYNSSLRRDIEGDRSKSLALDSNRVSAQGNDSTSEKFSQGWNSIQERNITGQNKHEEQINLQHQEQHSSETESKKHGSISESNLKQHGGSKESRQIPLQQNDSLLKQQTEYNPPQSSQNAGIQVSTQSAVHIREHDRTRHPNSDQQYSNLQKKDNPQSSTSEPSKKPNNLSVYVSLPTLLDVMRPHLDKDRNMQLQAMLEKWKRNEIDKDNLGRTIRSIVGNQMFLWAVNNVKLWKANPQVARQVQLQTSSQPQQQVKIPPTSVSLLTNSLSFSQLQQKGRMHYGVDMEAFSASLSRDIGGDSSTKQTPYSDRVSPPGNDSTSKKLFSLWQNSIQERNITGRVKQEEPNSLQPKEQHSSELDSKKHGSVSESNSPQLGCPTESRQLQQKTGYRPPPQSSQNAGIQVLKQVAVHMQEQGRERHHNNPQPSVSEPSLTEPNNHRTIVLTKKLLQVMMPHLDKDRAMQLLPMYDKLRRNEINIDGFIMIMRNIVGDKMVKQAANKLKMELIKTQADRDSQRGSQQHQVQSQTSQPQQQVKMPSMSASQTSDSDGLPSHCNNSTSEKLLSQQNFIQGKNITGGIKQQKLLQPQEQYSSELETKIHGSGSKLGCSKDNRLQQQTAYNPPQSSQIAKIQASEQNAVHNQEQDRKQHQNNPQLSASEPLTEPNNHNTNVATKMLVQVMMPQLDKDRVMQLQSINDKLRRNEIDIDGFIRTVRNIVGDRMVKQAATQLKFQAIKDQATRDAQRGSQQHQNNKHQRPGLQKINNSQPSAPEPNNHRTNVSIKMLLQVMMPHLDKDRVMQLQPLYDKLRRNEIDIDGFIRIMRNIVGGRIVKQAATQVKMQVIKTQAVRDSQRGSQQHQVQPQTSSQPQQQVKMPPMKASQLIDSRSFSQHHQKGQMPPTYPAEVPTATVQVQNDPSFSIAEINDQEAKVMKHMSLSDRMHASQVSSDSGTVKQERVLSAFPSQGLNKQSLVNLPQMSYPMYGATLGNSRAHVYSGSFISAPVSLKSTQDSQMRQAHLHENMFSTQPGGTTQCVSMPRSSNESLILHGVPLPQMTTPSIPQSNPAPWHSTMSNEQKGSGGPSMPYVKQETLDPSQEQQHKSQISAPSSSAAITSWQADQGNPALSQAVEVSNSLATASDSIVQTHTKVLSSTISLGPGTNIKTASKNPSVGQKKPMDALDIATPTPSKQQKVSSAFQDQSVEHLNVVTTVSGVDLSEEAEQLLSGPKESRASEATRRIVQEEEERLILQKASKNPSVGQRKPIDVLDTLPPTPSKKLNVSGTFQDRSIEHLNDVTAVSGVDLRKEVEQLLSGSKQSRASEDTRRIVPEEEERLILQKASKNHSVGQKKPIDTLDTPTLTLSKKQKVSGAFQDQSIEHLSDVTSVSGVDLSKEAGQLLSGPKESRTSEVTIRIVQEEEKRLILQNAPLQKRMAKIMSEHGIKNISNDVLRGLSLCIEERMRGFISNLIRVSKQRVDIKRSGHRTLITSDLCLQILLMNQKIKEDWEKKQAEETEKVQKLNEADGNTATDGERDKDKSRLKNLKEGDKMQAKAANVAARVAVGGDDMLLRWQLMAEKACQKREGVTDTGQASTSRLSTRVNRDAENRGYSTASGVVGRNFVRNPVAMPHKIARTLSVKDVITVLEREPQMSKSTLVYSLYGRVQSGADAAME